MRKIGELIEQCVRHAKGLDDPYQDGIPVVETCALFMGEKSLIVVGLFWKELRSIHLYNNGHHNCNIAFLEDEPCGIDDLAVDLLAA
jgi:hypothetical protein